MNLKGQTCPCGANPPVDPTYCLESCFFNQASVSAEIALSFLSYPRRLATQLLHLWAAGGVVSENGMPWKPLFDHKRPWRISCAWNIKFSQTNLALNSLFLFGGRAYMWRSFEPNHVLMLLKVIYDRAAFKASLTPAPPKRAVGRQNGNAKRKRATESAGFVFRG